LHAASREQLIGWMRACTTGTAQLRVWPPQRAPWIVAVYLSGSQRKPAELNEAHRRIAQAVATSFTQGPGR
jgi:hypothetical protein